MTLQQIFITNLKKHRKEQGISQMTLAELCNMGGNYIGQIEMGRRIPSFEMIEKIAAALEIPSHELFAWEKEERQKVQQMGAKEYLQKMPATVRKELVFRMTASIKKEIGDSLEPHNY